MHDLQDVVRGVLVNKDLSSVAKLQLPGMMQLPSENNVLGAALIAIFTCHMNTFL